SSCCWKTTRKIHQFIFCSDRPMHSKKTMPQLSGSSRLVFVSILLSPKRTTTKGWYTFIKVILRRRFRSCGKKLNCVQMIRQQTFISHSHSDPTDKSTKRFTSSKQSSWRSLTTSLPNSNSAELFFNKAMQVRRLRVLKLPKNSTPTVKQRTFN